MTSLYDESVKYWNSAIFTPSNASHVDLDKYLNILREKYCNGTVDYQVFDIIAYESPEFERVRLFEYLAKMRLWNNKTIINRFNEYKITGGIDLNKSFDDMHGYELPGYLASILQHGGAYSSVVSDMINYYNGLAAALALCDNDLNSRYIIKSHVAWSSYFSDVAWDNTLAVYSHRENKLCIIMATDTD
jgi:hypothetical protein